MVRFLSSVYCLLPFIIDYFKLKPLVKTNETVCRSEGLFYGHPNFSLAMFMPVLLAMLFILPHWWNNEKKTTRCNKIFTFALVLLQFYPQWKMLNVLYMGLWKKDVKWKEEKEKLQRNVGSLGKFWKNGVLFAL